MKITRISLWSVPLTSHTAYHMAGGETCDTVESVVLKLDTDAGFSGWDKAVHDAASLLEAQAQGCLDAVALKLSKFGGISAARAARDFCVHLGVMMCIEDTWGSDITTAAALHLGAATDPRRLLNVCDLSGYVSPRLDPAAPTRHRGRISPPEGSGLGVEPDEDILESPAEIFD